MSTLAIYLFGAPRVTVDGHPLHFARNKGVALLAYLAVTKLPHSRDALAALFWPDYGQTYARDNLRRTLSTLHQELNKEWLTIDRTTIRLPESAQVWVDVNHFQHLVARNHAHDHPVEQPCAICVADLAAATALYTDDFLRGFTLADSSAFDEWQTFVGDSLRTQLTHALDRLGTAYRVQGAYPSAIEQFRRRLALDPLHEPAQRQLIQLYLESGELTAARQQYEHCVELWRTEFNSPVAPATAQLYTQLQALQSQAAPPMPVTPRQTTTRATPRHNLPPATTSFVSRETEISAITALLAEPTCRLLTLVGPGGVGKTRLALQVARTLLHGDERERFGDGIFFLSLVGASTTDALAPALAQALGLAFDQQRPPFAQILSYLQDKALLLVADNLEHLLNVTERLLEIVAGAPNVKVLITSRSALNVQEEWLYPVAGLQTPDQLPTIPPEDALQWLERYSAIQLFVQRARQVDPTFTLATAATPVVRICQLTEGMPLGIELAASWLKTLSCTTIADEMARSLDILTTTMRNVPERHRSMRAVFEQSWQLISPQQRTVLQRLSIFRGGFQLAAASRIAQATLLDLAGLVEWSLLRVTRAEQEERYDLHELLRQFAAEKLVAASNEWQETQQRHAHYYLTWVSQSADDLQGPQGATILRAIDRDLDNLRAAWSWAVEQGAGDLLGDASAAFYSYYLTRSLFGEGEAALQSAITRLSSTVRTATAEKAIAQLQARLGVLCFEIGAYQRAIALLEQSQTLARRHVLLGEVAFCLHSLGFIYSKLGDRAAADDAYQACLALSRQLDDKVRMAEVLRDLTHTVRSEGNIQEAERYGQESLALSRALGEPRRIASVLVSLAMNAYLLGRYAETVRYGQESLAICQSIGDRHGALRSLMVMARAARGLGTAQLAAALPILLENLTLYRAATGKDTLISLIKVICEVAVDLGHFQLAYTHAVDLVTVAQQIDSPYAIGEPLRCLGLTALHLGDWATAEQSLRQSMQVSLTFGRLPALLDALHIWVQFLLQRTEGDATTKLRAVEILALLIHHPATAHLDQLRATQLPAEIKHDLPPAVAAAAYEQGQNARLETVVQAIIVGNNR